MSSCPSGLEDLKKEREDALRVVVRQELRTAAMTFCSGDSVDISIDLALHINRLDIVAKTMIELGNELGRGLDPEHSSDTT